MKRRIFLIAAGTLVAGVVGEILADRKPTDETPDAMSPMDQATADRIMDHLAGSDPDYRKCFQVTVRDSIIQIRYENRTHQPDETDWFNHGFGYYAVFDRDHHTGVVVHYAMKTSTVGEIYKEIGTEDKRGIGGDQRLQEDHIPLLAEGDDRIKAPWGIIYLHNNQIPSKLTPEGQTIMKTVFGALGQQVRNSLPASSPALQFKLV
jgi:hypothetical protein